MASRFIVASIAVVVLCASLLLPAFVYAAGTGDVVYVTISDGTGKLVSVRSEVALTDKDNDGKLTINDALYAVHDKDFEGGAAAGYASESSQYGLSLTKLWGVANGGSYGYYVNNSSAMGLTDEVKNGDHVQAYIYQDLTAWSDQFCYFDKGTVSGKNGDSVTLTLSAVGFDAEYNTVISPVVGAKITVDGEVVAGAVTDSNGQCTVKLDKTGTIVVSAASDTATLVPPVCVATVTAQTTEPANPTTGSSAYDAAIWAVAAGMVISIIAAISVKRRISAI